MADDEPLDDARAVAMTVGAAAARVVETLAREGQHAVAQHRALLERAQNQQRARLAPLGLGNSLDGRSRLDAVTAATAQLEVAELRQAQQWASPERLESHHYDREGCDSIEGRRSVDRNLIQEWKAATTPYDSADRRRAADGVREAAGVPAEVRQTRATADLMNGTDPAQAAAKGQTTVKAQMAPAVQPSRQANRTR